jgi:uncharacterized membrane protein
MAGIGFELKKLFVGRGVIKKIRAYAYAGVICSGTMFLAILLLLGMRWMAEFFGTSRHQQETMVVMMVYALLGSMLLGAILQTFLSRYVADMLYQEKAERVLPSLFGASLVLMVPGGVVYALLLSTAPTVSIGARILNWALFMELIPVWLEMSYITAAKDYRRILEVFALGIGLALALAFVQMSMGIAALEAIMLSLCVGYGVMLIGFMEVLLKYFPLGKGSLFAFVSWFSSVPDLMLTGFLGMGGTFVPIILMWFSPIGESVVGAFRQAVMHDSPAFYAYLVTLPTNINFIVSVEVNFYQKYRRYFRAITEGGTLSEFTLARENMRNSLQQELSKLTQTQIFFMVVYIIAMRYLLPMIGFTTDMIVMLQVMSIGYSAYAIGNSVMLLQLYFNDRKGAMFTCGTFFAVNLIGTLGIMRGPMLYYGTGLAAAGIAMYVIGLPRLLFYVKNIDYNVFCSQAVFNAPSNRFWKRVADRLDAISLKQKTSKEDAA